MCSAVSCKQRKCRPSLDPLRVTPGQHEKSGPPDHVAVVSKIIQSAVTAAQTKKERKKKRKFACSHSGFFSDGVGFFSGGVVLRKSR
jgi:hypothetical protein